MPVMPNGDKPDGGGGGLDDLYGDGGGLNDLYGDYDLADYLYETPPVEIDYFGSNPSPDLDPVMYFDQITTTTVPPDMYDYLFAFEKPSRNRIKGPTRKKFDAQALKAAYATLLEKSKTQPSAERAPRRVTRSLFNFDSIYKNFDSFGGVEELARQFLQRFTGPGPKPKLLGLLDRRAPEAFRQNTFVKISLSQFSIVSTGTTGKNDF